MNKRIISLFCCLFPAVLFGAMLIVPIDHETIQEAIDASEDGDTLFVMPGEYVENINFDGKAIKLLATGSQSCTDYNRWR